MCCLLCSGSVHEGISHLIKHSHSDLMQRFILSSSQFTFTFGHVEALLLYGFYVFDILSHSHWSFIFALRRSGISAYDSWYVNEEDRLTPSQSDQYLAVIMEPISIKSRVHHCQVIILLFAKFSSC